MSCTNEKLFFFFFFKEKKSEYLSFHWKFGISPVSRRTWKMLTSFHWLTSAALRLSTPTALEFPLALLSGLHCVLILLIWRGDGWLQRRRWRQEKSWMWPPWICLFFFSARLWKRKHLICLIIQRVQKREHNWVILVKEKTWKLTAIDSPIWRPDQSS